MESIVEAMGSPLTADDINGACQELSDCILKMYGATEVAPEILGLDYRCGKRIWRGDGFLAVDSFDNAKLRYYGGFEYVSAEHTVTLGRHVFYFTTDDLVMRHWSILEEEDGRNTEATADQS